MENNQPPPPPAEPPLYSQQNNPFLLQQQQQLQMFWTYQRQEIERTNDFKSHQLPLARIKKIMKADEDVRMISAEAPVLFSKACELFILELTIRSWLNAEENKRRTLQRDDIAAAITGNQFFDFMIDIVPRNEIRDAAAGIGIVNSASGGIPYNYLPMGHPAAMTGLYMQPPSMAWQSVWQTADDESYIGRGQQQGGNVDGQS